MGYRKMEGYSYIEIHSITVKLVVLDTTAYPKSECMLIITTIAVFRFRFKILYQSQKINSFVQSAHL